MQKDYAHIIVVLDASSSMNPLVDEVKGAFRAFVAEQRSQGGKTVTDVFQFASDVKRIVRSSDLNGLQKHVEQNYECGGCTALYDGICTAIDTVGQEFAAMRECDRPEDVLLVIVTDGEENSSREFNAEDVRSRIELQEKTYSWRILYLASGVDLQATARDIGVTAPGRAREFAREQMQADFSCALSEEMKTIRAERAKRRG